MTMPETGCGNVSGMVKDMVMHADFGNLAGRSGMARPVAAAGLLR
jgi:hypothetical protein